MKAVRIHGGSERLRFDELPVPLVAPGELLIRMFAAGVNPIDWKMCDDERFRARWNIPLPMTLGCEISGVIHDVGAGVEQFRCGQEAFALIGSHGAFAEYVRVAASSAALKPAGLTHVYAASIPVAAQTAWQGLFDCGGLERGQRVLIHAAAGGVGSFAIQFAHQRGAHVTVTTSTDNADYVRSLGADDIIDYRSVPFEECTRDLDLVFDLLGGETQHRSWSVLKPGGMLVSALGEPVDPPANRHARKIEVQPNGMQLSDIANRVAAGTVRACVTKIFPFAKAAEALELSRARRTRGKIVLQFHPARAAGLAGADT